MYNISKKITVFFIENGVIEAEEKEIYEYEKDVMSAIDEKYLFKKRRVITWM